MKFEVIVQKVKDDLTIEDALFLNNLGISVICEDGCVTGFEFVYGLQSAFYHQFARNSGRKVENSIHLLNKRQR